MTLGELLKGATEQDFLDLQALIMFLVFEKKVHTLNDDEKVLDLYFLEKHRPRMTKEINSYKEKMRMSHKAEVFEVNINPKRGFKVIYILAQDQIQAESFTRSLFYEPISTSICDDDQLMTKYNRNNEPINIKIKDLKNNKIPSFLGGY